MSDNKMVRGAGVALLAAALLLQGCSSLRSRSAGDRLDPWENWNRKVFNFNEDLDKNVLKPVATGYSNVVPQPIRRGVDNFFNNFADGWSAINSMLQGKVTNGLHDLIRFSTNTVFGLGGVLDIASEFGLEHHYEDFGQTLGAWGFKSGPYIVWPILGPSAVRESIALPLDLSATPSFVFNGGANKFGIGALEIVNKRANLLGASNVIDDIALDKYTFIRDAYLQRRRSLISDGNDTDDGGNDANAPAGPTSAPAGAAPAQAASAPGAPASAAGTAPAGAK